MNRTLLTTIVAGVGILCLYVISLSFMANEEVVTVNTLTPAEYSIVTDGARLLLMGVDAFNEKPSDAFADLLGNATRDYLLVLQGLCTTRLDEPACVVGVNAAEVAVGVLGEYYGR